MEDGSLAITPQLPRLAETLGVDVPSLESFLQDLESDVTFLDAINAKVRGVPEFDGKQFSSVHDLRAYRVALYLITRSTQPEVVVETGVLNGMGSAFLLLALEHNKRGELESVDVPPNDPRILAQGTAPLPQGSAPGWIIPDALRDRHRLNLGFSQEILPALLREKGSIGLFIHDSDHSYAHISFEVALAWQFLDQGGAIVVDNVEQNEAFRDFARGVSGDASSEVPHMILETFNHADRVWLHGVLSKR